MIQLFSSDSESAAWEIEGTPRNRDRVRMTDMEIERIPRGPDRVRMTDLRMESRKTRPRENEAFGMEAFQLGGVCQLAEAV